MTGRRAPILATTGYPIKLCRGCGLFYPLSDFYDDPSKEDGHSTECRGCQSTRAWDRYQGKRDEILAKARFERTGSRASRLCRVCEEPTWKPKSPYCKKHSDEALDRQMRKRHRRKYMTEHEKELARERERRKKIAINARLPYWIYGNNHQRTRRQWVPLVATGNVACWRCGELIRPDEKWHLGHVDGDPTRYAGPEHVHCNCATATPGRLTNPKLPRRRDPVTHRFLPND